MNPPAVFVLDSDVFIAYSMVHGTTVVTKEQPRSDSRASSTLSKSFERRVSSPSHCRLFGAATVGSTAHSRNVMEAVAE